VVYEITMERPNPGGEELTAILKNPPPEISANVLAKLKALSSNVMKQVMKMTIELLKITPEIAKLQIENSAEILGSPMHVFRTTKTVRAKAMPSPKKKKVWTSKIKDGSGTEVTFTPFSSLKKESPPIERSDELEIAGRTFRCRSVENTFTDQEHSFWTKTWYSEEIPGGVASQESKWARPSSQSQRMIVTKFEKR
jgi:hypothetical protein